MKRKKKMLILVLLLIGAVLAYVGISKWSENAASAGDSTADGEYTALLSFGTADAVKLTWSYEGENGTESYTLEKSGSVWIWPEDETMILDQEAVESLLQTVAGLSAESAFSVEEDADLSQYGMDEPMSRIQVEFSEESGLKPVTLLTGDYNYTVYGYYTMVEGDQLIGLTDGTHTDLFMQTPQNLEYVEDTESTEESESTEGTDTAE